MVKDFAQKAIKASPEIAKVDHHLIRLDEFT